MSSPQITQMNADKKINRRERRERKGAKTQRGTGVKTWSEVKACLHKHIEMIRRSYREVDGNVHAPQAIHDIACLRKALRLCLFALKKKGTT